MRNIKNFKVKAEFYPLSFDTMEKLIEPLNERVVKLKERKVDNSMQYELLVHGVRVMKVEKMLLDRNSVIVIEEEPYYKINPLCSLMKALIQRYVSQTILDNKIRSLSSKEIAGHRTVISSCNRIVEQHYGYNLLSLIIYSDVVVYQDDTFYAYAPFISTDRRKSLKETDLLPNIKVNINGVDQTNDILNKIKENDYFIGLKDRCADLRAIGDVLRLESSRGLVSRALGLRRQLLLCLSDVLRVEVLPTNLDVSESHYYTQRARENLYRLSLDERIKDDVIVDPNKQFKSVVSLLTSDVAKAIVAYALYGVRRDELFNDRVLLRELLRKTINDNASLNKNSTDFDGLYLDSTYLTRDYNAEEIREGVKESIDLIFFLLMLIDDNSLITFDGDRAICDINLNGSNLVNLIVPFLVSED